MPIDIELNIGEQANIDWNVITNDYVEVESSVVLPVISGSSIKSISRNGIELPIIEGNVDIEVPTKTSELVNDSNFVASNELSSVAFSGDYDDLENKPDIEDIASNVANSAVSTHNESENAHTDIRNEIETVKDIAEGANIAIVFDSYSDLVTFFNAESDSLKVGTNLYVKTVEVPDLWLSAVEETTVSYTYTTDEDFLTYINGNGQIGYYKFSELETQKVDLSNYATLTDLGTKVSKSGDTMTGGLLLSTVDGNNWFGAYRGSQNLNRDCIYFSSSGAGLHFATLNSTYTGVSTRGASYTNSTGIVLYGSRSVYTGGSSNTEDRLQRYDEIYTTGIVRDNKTWVGNTYTVSDPVTGPIPNDFIETVTLIGANFNATTLYFELNGLTDITYEEMRRIYEYSPKVIYGVTWQFMFGDSSGKKKFRTNFFNYPTSTSWGNCNINNIARANTTIETVSLVQDTLKPSWESVIEAGYTFDSVNAINLNTYGYMWQGSQSWSNAFDGCTRLKHIDGILRFALSTSTAARVDVFKSCANLETVWVHMLDHNLSFEDSPYLKLDCLQFIVAKKYNATNAVTVTVHPDCYTRCQADTKQYTHSGQTYTGIIAYAAAKGLTITN